MNENPGDAQPKIHYYLVQLTSLTREGDAVGQVIAALPDDMAFPIDVSALDPIQETGSGNSTASGETGGNVPDSLPQQVRVPAGIPGEQVIVSVEEPRVRPQRRKKHRRKLPPRISIVLIVQASPWRVQAPCPQFGACGGCQFQHIDYTRQLEIKRQMVINLLLEEGGFAAPSVLPTLGCTVPWRYRNHMRFSVNREGQVGLTARGTHRVLPLDDCPIAYETINRALRVLASSPQPRPQALVRCGAQTGQVMLQPLPTPEMRARLEAEGLDVREESMEEELVGARFRIRPSSFFQTNTAQAEQMAALVLRGLEVSPQMIIADAYCGVGTFALLLARHARQVIAIEESASAVRDALWNVREASNVRILQGKTEALLPTLTETIDGLVLDPPRQGCQRPVLDALVARRIPRVVYVSCDPATLARDLNFLCHLLCAYALHEVQPLDMFPQTAHIECVAILRAH